MSNQQTNSNLDNTPLGAGGIELNKYSKTLTQDETQPAAQAMLYAIGMTEADMKKAQVGIVSMGWEGNPCTMHLNDLSHLFIIINLHFQHFFKNKLELIL